MNGEFGFVQAVNPAPDLHRCFERFQLGGEQSMRGFSQGAVVPLHPEDQPVFTDATAGSSAATSFS